MTGLYKTQSERTFLNYYAVMPLSNDRFAQKYRRLLCFGSLSLTFATLGAYPLLLGLFMCGEYLLKGRVTLNIDSLADTIDRVIKSSQKLTQKSYPNSNHLANVQQNVQLSKFPSDIQNLIMSKTGADLNQLKLASREFQTKTKISPLLGYRRDLKELKDFLKTKDDLIKEIDTRFQPNIKKDFLYNEKYLVFKETDFLTKFLLIKLTKEEVNKLKGLPGFSSDFQDLLWINQKLKEITDTQSPEAKASFVSIIELLCEKEMFFKAFDVIDNKPKSYEHLLIKDCLEMIFKSSLEKNQFRAAFEAARKINGRSSGYFYPFIQVVEKLCSLNQFGAALKAINNESSIIVNVFPVFLNKLCEKGLFDEAKSAIDLMVVNVGTKEFMFLQDIPDRKCTFLHNSYRIIAAKLCEQYTVSDLLNLREEYATKEPSHPHQLKLLVWIIENLAKNEKYSAAENLLNEIPKFGKENEEFRKEAITSIYSAYMENGLGDYAEIWMQGKSKSPNTYDSPYLFSNLHVRQFQDW